MKNHKIVFPSTIFVAIAVCFAASRTANTAQSSALVRLQATTPGSAQDGHINITGGMIAGTYRGDGSGLSGISWNGLADIPAGFADNIDNIGPTYSAGAGLSLAGTVFSIADLGVTSAKLASSAVTTAKIADLNVSSNKLAANAVIDTKIADGAVGTAKLSAAGSSNGNVLTSSGGNVVWAAPVAGLQLPFAGSAGTNSTTSVFDITQTSVGRAGLFTVNNASHSGSALEATSNGNGVAFTALMTGTGNALSARGTGTGRVGLFQLQNAASTASALFCNTTGTGFCFEATAVAAGSNAAKMSSQAGTVGLQVIGGSKSAVVGTSSGARLLYCEESTVLVFSDYGFGQLKNGVAHIAIDPTFGETVTLDDPYQVFVSLEGDCNGVFVTNKTSNGFDVVELRKGNSNVDFSYRIVAKRRGYEDTRLGRAPWSDNDPNIRMLERGEASRRARLNTEGK